MKFVLPIGIAAFFFAFFGCTGDIDMTIPDDDFLNDMKYIEGDTFQLGWLVDGTGKTIIVNDFYICKYEITTNMFCKFLNEIGCDSTGYYNGYLLIGVEKKECYITWSEGKFIAKYGKHIFPANCITWNGANEFCGHYGGRLPSEEEWEYIAGYDYTGGEIYPNQIIMVGQTKRNKLGLYDLNCNIWEWTTANNFYSYYPNAEENRLYTKYDLSEGMIIRKDTRTREQFPVTVAKKEFGFRIAFDSL